MSWEERVLILYWVWAVIFALVLAAGVWPR